MNQIGTKRGRWHWPFRPSSAVWPGYCLMMLGLVSACSGHSVNGTPPQLAVSEAVPVSLATVTQKAAPVQVRGIGSVEAHATIAVKAQVEGVLTGVHFIEGQEVKKGSLLFTIDRRPFETALRQAEANLAKDMAQANQAEAVLARDMAQAKNAEVDAHRYAELLKRQLVAPEDYDQRRTTADALEASVRADQAAVETAQAVARADQAAMEQAKLQLGYSTIYAPIDGRTGALLVDVGNVVRANDTTLVTIEQLTPIDVTFSVPEQELPAIKKYMAQGQLSMEASIPMDADPPERGVLVFVDNAIDRTTGTIRLKGMFANDHRRLWPGQFVNVTLTLTTQPDAIVVPSPALQVGQHGQYVFVVKPDLTVESRPVTVGSALDGESVVERGLQPGERVVTDGQLRLAPGSRVEIKGSAPDGEAPRT